MKTSSLPADPGIHIAWWNTGLSPTRVPDRAGPAHFQAAAQVLRHLIEVVRADVIVLGEMAERSIDGLHDACPIARADYTWLKAFHPAGRSRFSQCVLSRTDRITVEFDRSIIQDEGGGISKVGQAFLVRLRDGNQPLHLIASHWPSRLFMDRHDVERTHLAAFLRRWIDDQILRYLPDANVVLVGDFNDEPFDEGMERHLHASRDRDRVKRNRRLFYNPFWRHLHAFPPGAAEDRSCGPGTYFHAGGRFSHWRTFDQLIVSSSVLCGRFGWRLNEANTRVAPLPALESSDDPLAPHPFFDHLPIVGHFDRQPSPTSRASRARMATS